MAKHGHKNVAHSSIDGVSAYLSIEDCFFQLGAEECVVGHLLIEAAICRGDSRVCCSPVAHDPAVELELLSQHALKQCGILAGVDPIRLYVGAHKSIDTTLTHCRFERGKIDFLERPFINY